jgi:hypothetical protein
MVVPHLESFGAARHATLKHMSGPPGFSSYATGHAAEYVGSEAVAQVCRAANESRRADARYSDTRMARVSFEPARDVRSPCRAPIWHK